MESHLCMQLTRRIQPAAPKCPDSSISSKESTTAVAMAPQSFPSRTPFQYTPPV